MPRPYDIPVIAIDENHRYFGRRRLMGLKAG
jgi:hypothetical protein